MERDDESSSPLIFNDRGSTGRDWSLFNIVILGLSFMLLFSAFQTCSMVETLVLEGARIDSNGTFKGTGPISLSIIYGVFAASNWIAPSVVAVLGAKWSMVAGAFLYCWYIALFLKPMEWTLYLTSALVGLGAAVLWTAQGNFLTINSNLDTISRNTGIFWALFQASLLIGNIFVYFEFTEETIITSKQRTLLFIVLTVVACLGTLLMLVFRKSGRENSVSGMSAQPSYGPLEALKRSVQLLFKKEMLLLCVCFAYTGLEQSFFLGIYGTAIGHTLQMTDAKRMTGLSGVFIGVGEIVGGSVFGLLGNRPTISRHGRDSVVLFGFVVHVVCFYLIFINLPDESPLRDTYGSGSLLMSPNVYLAMVCAFLLGLGDSSFNTQIYPILGSLYPEDSASACAIYKFIQALAATAIFVYTPYLVLKWHLVIMTSFAVVGSIFFFVVDRWATQSRAARPVSDTEIQHG